MFNKKKRYFADMLTDAERVIYDLEFKKFTALNEYEFVRKQYDQAQDALARITAQLLNGPDPKLDDDKKAIEARVTDLKGDLDAIQGSIVGAQPSEKLPNGSEGIDNKLKSWVQRREYIRAFINQYC